MTLQERLDMLNEQYADELAAIREEFKGLDTLDTLAYIEHLNKVALDEIAK